MGVPGAPSHRIDLGVAQLGISAAGGQLDFEAAPANLRKDAALDFRGCAGFYMVRLDALLDAYRGWREPTRHHCLKRCTVVCSNYSPHVHPYAPTP